MTVKDHHYKNLVEEANDGMVILDLKGKFKYLNRAAEKISGYKSKELLDKPVPWLIWPEYMEETMERLKTQGLNKIEAYTYELEISNKRGDRVPIEFTISLVTESGEPTGYQVIVRDISERWEREENFENYKRCLELVNKIALAGIFTVNPQLEVVSWNRAAEELTGYKPREVLGKVCPFIADCGNTCLLYSHKFKKPIYDFHAKLRTKDGKTLKVKKAMAHIKGKDGAQTCGMECFVLEPNSK